MRFLKNFEIIVTWILMVLIAIVVIASLLQVGYAILGEIFCTATPLINVSQMPSILGSLLMVLIGLELLQTVKEYLKEQKLHVEMVIMVALVAIARKVIIFDYKDTSWQYLIGMGVLFITLSAGYYMIKKGMQGKSSQTVD